MVRGLIAYPFSSRIRSHPQLYSQMKTLEMDMLVAFAMLRRRIIGDVLDWNADVHFIDRLERV